MSNNVAGTEQPAIKVLVVDDVEPWRRFVVSKLEQRARLKIVGEAADGLEAIRKVEELRPDLVVMDVGLPSLNGIETAKRIRENAPTSIILFVSANRCAEVVDEAFCIGALGYVVKHDTARELLPAVDSVLQGKRFLARSLMNQESCDFGDGQSLAAKKSPQEVSYNEGGSTISGRALRKSNQ